MCRRRWSRRLQRKGRCLKHCINKEKRMRGMEIYYSSTRGKESHVTASQAILKGLADDGGLFMPDKIPSLDRPLREFASMSY